MRGSCLSQSCAEIEPKEILCEKCVFSDENRKASSTCRYKEKIQMIDGNLYVDKVIRRFTREITDRVFLMIESDSTLKQEYDDLTRNDVDKHALNSTLGKEIRKALQLPNTGRCDAPESTLIDSYECHEIVQGASRVC